MFRKIDDGLGVPFVKKLAYRGNRTLDPAGIVVHLSVVHELVGPNHGVYGLPKGGGIGPLKHRGLDEQPLPETIILHRPLHEQIDEHGLLLAQ